MIGAFVIWSTFLFLLKTATLVWLLKWVGVVAFPPGKVKVFLLMKVTRSWARLSLLEVESESLRNQVQAARWQERFDWPACRWQATNPCRLSYGTLALTFAVGMAVLYTNRHVKTARSSTGFVGL